MCVATALLVDMCIFGVLCVFQLHPVHWNIEAFLELLPLWLFIYGLSNFLLFVVLLVTVCFLILIFFFFLHT